MKSTITTDQYRDLLDREFRGDFGEEGLGSDFQWFADNLKTVRSLRTGQQQFPCEIICPELIPKNYTVVEDVEKHKFSVTDLELLSFLEGKESSTTGTLMRERSTLLNADYGLSDAPTILGEDGEGKSIPKEWRGKYLVFAGTLLRRSGGDLCVPVIYWRDGLWILGFLWLGGGWDGYGRLVRSKH